MNKRLSVLSLNIGNPCLDRAKRQCSWLQNRREDVFVLTETKESKGCAYIKDFFSQYGYDLFSATTGIEYDVNAPASKTGDLGVMVISKLPIHHSYNYFPADSIYFARQTESVIVPQYEPINIMGIYVPSRDRSDRKIERKRKYIEGIEMYLNERKRYRHIIMGDLNILEKSHIPHYSTYFEWEYRFYDAFAEAGYIDAFRFCHFDKQEYSWVGRTNHGYRYDYCFVSSDMRENIVNCEYIHETRTMRITDHSAIRIELKI